MRAVLSRNARGLVLECAWSCRGNARAQDQGPGTKDQGPGTRDQGPGPGTRGAGMGTVASMGKGTFKFPELLIVASLLQYSFGDDVLFLRA